MAALSLVAIFVSLGMLQVKVTAAIACTYVNGSTEIESDICLNFTEAMQFIDRDNVQIILESGEHMLWNTNMSIVSNLSGISFVGLGESPADVKIVCQDNAGLVFLRSDRLTVRSLSLVSCSLGANLLTELQEFTERTFEQVIKIPPGLNTALFISDSADVSVSSVVISDTTGIGLVGLNLMGESEISHVQFNRNRPLVAKCPELNIHAEANGDLVGGGLYLLYQDYKPQHSEPIAAVHMLTVSNCQFHGNEDCSDVWVTELFFQLSTRLKYSFGGGGGMTILHTQTQYTVHSHIQNSIFEFNSAKFGSGAHVGFFTGSRNSAASFYDCHFNANGKSDNPYSGGGLAVLFDLVRPTGVPVHRETSNGSLVSLVNTHFTRNTAFFGGGVFSYALSESCAEQNRFVIQSCTFRQNRAPVAAALLMYVRGANIFKRQFLVEIGDTLIEENLSNFDSNVNEQVLGITSMFRGVQLTLSGNTGFYGNIGTALVAATAHMYVDGNITFAETTGFVGTLRLTELSTLTLRQNSVLRFSKNSILPFGGGIHEGSHGSHIRYSQNGCFLYFQEINLLPQIESCPDFTGLNVSIVFDGNRALLGTSLYGSSLENCNWASCLRNRSDRTVLETLEDLNIFKHIAIDNDTQTLEVSTTSSKIVFPNYTEQHVMPGETFYVNTLSLDELNQSIFTGLGAALFGRQSEFEVDNLAQVRLGPNGYWFIDRSPDFVGSPTPISIHGPQDKELIVAVSSLEDSLISFNTFNVTLTNCSLGFRYNPHSRTCVCETAFSDVGIVCDSSRAIIRVPSRVWAGPIVLDDQTFFGHTSCLLTYCRSGAINITKDNFNILCIPTTNREGIGCGQCPANYSITFGSNACLQCSNYYLFLILVFMLAGFGTMCFFAVLRITISEGYLNSVLFYSNVVNLFSTILPVENGFLVPIRWISQNLGIRTCFFDGMTTLHAYALRFVYVAYLFLLMVLVTLLSKYVQVPRSYIYSPTKVLATLFILCYTSLLEACVSIFAFTPVYLSDGRVLTRWFFDPNVVYFEGLHIFLFILALAVTLFFLIPFPIFTLSPRLVLRVKFLSRFKPLLDPVWAPLKPNYEWWVSFRLFFRWIPVIMSTFVPLPENLFIVGIFLLCLLFLQMKLQPFQGLLRNTFDDLLVTNLVVLIIGYLFFAISSDAAKAIIYGGVFLFLAYVIFVAILIAQFDLHYSNQRKKLVRWIQRRLLKKEPVSENGETRRNQGSPSNNATHSEVVVSPRSHQHGGSISFAAPDASGVLKDNEYRRYRESLLADEEEDQKLSSGLLDTLKSIQSQLETAV